MRQAPPRAAPGFALVAALAFGGVAAALVSQHVYDMQPCAWCVLQRLVFIVIGLVALAGLAWRSRRGARVTAGAVLVLAACGVADYTRASTRLTAKAAKPMLALRLRLEEGAPILRSEAVNVDGEGRVVEVGTTWFAGDRVTLTVGGD